MVTTRILDWKSERDDAGRIAAASMTCPSCGERTHTGMHEIRERGVVFPAIECDHSCGWIDHVVLVGWPWGRVPRGGPP